MTRKLIQNAITTPATISKTGELVARTSAYGSVARRGTQQEIYANVRTDHASTWDVIAERQRAVVFTESSRPPNVLPLSCAAFTRQNTKTSKLRRPGRATGRVSLSGGVRRRVLQLSLLVKP